MNILISSISEVFYSIASAFFAVALSVSSFLGFIHPVIPTPIVIVDVEPPTQLIATSSSVIASTTTTITTSVPKKIVPVPVPLPTPKIIPEPPPIIISPCQTTSVGTSTTNSIGTTTLAVQNVPLLIGGTAHSGESVPISYLQITNIGERCALLTGFWVKQKGSAHIDSIVGLSTVDDKGGSRGLVGGIEGATTSPFQNNMALAPTNALFAPGQMRLFTIKAIMAYDTTLYIGMQLMIDVESIETTSAVRGQFPIRGTTWTISK